MVPSGSKICLLKEIVILEVWGGGAPQYLKVMLYNVVHTQIIHILIFFVRVRYQMYKRMALQMAAKRHQRSILICSSIFKRIPLKGQCGYFDQGVQRQPRHS